LSNLKGSKKTPSQETRVVGDEVSNNWIPLSGLRNDLSKAFLEFKAKAFNSKETRLSRTTSPENGSVIVANFRVPGIDITLYTEYNETQNLITETE
jgi:hypothetical protein